MGFIDYAWSISIQKDETKVKILQDKKLLQPTLQADNFGYTIRLPAPHLGENGNLSFLKYNFKADNSGKYKIGRLFRAAVLHLTTHTLAPFSREKIAPNPSDSIVEAFAKSIVNDLYVNSYISVKYPNRLFDIAFANAVAFQKIKKSERIFTPSTRLMAALLTRINTGLIKNSSVYEEEQTLDQIFTGLTALTGIFKASLASIPPEQRSLQELFDENVKKIKGLIEPFGPFLEAPSLCHTESLGQCSIYSEIEPENNDFDMLFVQSLKSLGGSVPPVEKIENCWGAEQDVEALQAFNSDYYQKQREEKILAKMLPYISLTKFKSISFPEEDYTQYLRARTLVQGASRRLLEILRTAFDYLDEDPRQEMGQLDLAAVIQSIASRKPATDVFTLDEYLKPNFAWSIVLDVSNSMQVKGEYGRALAIAVAEAAKELMTDPTSWTFFAFSDKLFVLKDSSESYSKRVRARIGGLKFEGLTFIPDAIQMAGKMLAKRFEEQRCLIVISDGWPYGYPDMPLTLKERVEDLLKKGVIVIGIGVETDRMDKFFHLHSSIFTQKDLINKFGSTYLNASAKALET